MRSYVSTSGVNGTVATSNHDAQIKLQSRFNSYIAVIECIVTNQVTDKIPAFLKWDKFEFPHNIRLANPQFHVFSNGRWSFEWSRTVLEPNMYRSSQVRQTSNVSKDATRLNFSGSFGQYHADGLKNPLTIGIYNQFRTAWTVSCTWQMDDISMQSNNYTMEENICERHFLDSEFSV